MGNNIHIVEWEGSFHIQANNEPIVTDLGNIISSSNRTIFERLILEKDVLNCYMFRVLSDINDKIDVNFNSLWSNINYMTLCGIENDSMELNVPSFTDNIRKLEIILGQAESLKKRVKLEFSQLYDSLSNDKQVLSRSLVEQGFEICFVLFFMKGECSLNELLENQNYLQSIKFGDNTNHFVKALGDDFKSIIEVFALL